LGKEKEAICPVRIGVTAGEFPIGGGVKTREKRSLILRNSVCRDFEGRDCLDRQRGEGAKMITVHGKKENAG
jgi:hypothetical protein